MARAISKKIQKIRIQFYFHFFSENLFYDEKVKNRTERFEGNREFKMETL
jgi:hypothetical protein